MSMIDTKVIKKVAKLSNFLLTQEEERRTFKEMSKILEHFKELERIDTEGVQPLYTPIDMENLWRVDEIAVEETLDSMLNALVETMEGQLKVPQVV